MSASPSDQHLTTQPAPRPEHSSQRALVIASLVACPKTKR